jgi:chloramphenicol 3-O phosphotransferase
VTTQVIVLNGGSSSGKSGIVRCLQAVLPDPWLAFGVDTLIQAMPVSTQTSAAGIEIAPDGDVIVGPEFRALETAWIEGMAAMARARIIIDEVFLGGAASQQRWKTALNALQVLWVGVWCESTVTAGRESARGDRVTGMAASQAEKVHQGVRYDLQARPPADRGHLQLDNLSLTASKAKYASLDTQIVHNLGSPDVLAVQEIQDNDGVTDDGVVAANVTMSDLGAAIVAAGAPTYAWTEIDPVNDQDGGQPAATSARSPCTAPMLG